MGYFYADGNSLKGMSRYVGYSGSDGSYEVDKRSNSYTNYTTNYYTQGNRLYYTVSSNSFPSLGELRTGYNSWTGNRTFSFTINSVSGCDGLYLRFVNTRYVASGGSGGLNHDPRLYHDTSYTTQYYYFDGIISLQAKTYNLRNDGGIYYRNLIIQTLAKKSSGYYDVIAESYYTLNSYSNDHAVNYQWHKTYHDSNPPVRFTYED